jgi:dolichyl-phosphate beta-glucosyltransferase
VLAVWSRWRERATWLLAAAFVLIVTLSLGPMLHVVGRPSVWLPWSIVAHLPGLSQALPSRLSMYAWLVAAILVSRWLAGGGAAATEARASRPGHRVGPWAKVWTGARWALVALVALSILPIVPPAATPTVPGFFADGTYRGYLRPGEIVLTLPFTTPDPEMLWQVETSFGFRMAGGYVGARAIPPDERSKRAFHGLIWGRPWRVPASALRAYMVEHQVGAVILDHTVPEEWQRLFGALGLRRELVGGVILYRVPAGFATSSP